MLCAGSTLLPVRSYAEIGTINKFSEPSPKPASINLQKWFLSPTGLIKPWFHTERNLPLRSAYLPLEVPNWVASTANQAFFWRCCREERGFCKGSLSLPIFYFVIVLLTYFLYFNFVASFYQKYKKIVPFIVGILLLLVHYVVP
jgi:hypothetical protein